MWNRILASAGALGLGLCAYGAAAQTATSPANTQSPANTPSPANAQGNTANPPPDAAAAQQADVNLDQVNVTSHRFLDQETSGITNLPLPIEQVPQSITIINNNFARAADIQNMADLAQYTTGAVWYNYIPSYGNGMWLRGFNAGFAVDGLPVGTQGDYPAEPDPAIIERFEVVKGPASVVYGAESPGGIVNMVSKSATADTQNYVTALGGSWGHWRLEGQLSGPLNSTGSVRGIAVIAQEEGGGYVDNVNINKTVIYGGLDFDLTSELTGYVRVSYQRLDNTAFNGIPVYPNGSLPPVGPSFFVGGSDFNTIAQITRANAGLTWKPSDLWSIDLKGIYMYTTHGGENAYSSGFIANNGSFPVSGEVFNNWNVNDFTVAATALRYLDDIGLNGSSVSGSLRYQHYRYNILESFLQGTANINESDDQISNYFNTGLTPTATPYQQNQTMDYLTASTQAVIKVLPRVSLIGGFAYSVPWINYQVYNGPWQNLSPGGQTSFRGAVVYEPIDHLNVYFSYSQSFEPNLRLDTSYQVLQPLSGEQYEVGAKYLTPDKRLLLTAALFTINENNVPEYAATVNNEALYKAAGVRHRGLELEATGQIIDHWQIKAGLALLDPTVTQDPSNPVNVGETRPWIPRATANLFSIYTFNNGLSLGGGVRFVGSVKTYDNSSPPTAAIPAYTLVDLVAGYTIGSWHLQANLKNIFNTKYYIAPWQTYAYGLYPGQPASYTLSVTKTF